MAFIPYLNFDGNCAEAMTFYAKLFNATELQILRYSDAPASEGLPPSDAVMYSHIMLGEACLMGSDHPPGSDPEPMTSVSVNHPVATPQEGQAIFDQLAEGGTILMPYEKTFFSSAFGMVRDRFGTSWMIGVLTE